MIIYQGSIERCLQAGEYDQGDECMVSYDELSDLRDQLGFIIGVLKYEMSNDLTGDGTPYRHMIERLQKRTNRPLHPLLGGPSPYKEFLPQ